jgi:hypothetical protein
MRYYAVNIHRSKTMKERNYVKEAVYNLNRDAPIRAAADACKVTRRTIHNWIKKGRLPHTDYSGETHYAEALAAASGGQFTATWLLEVTSKR